MVVIGESLGAGVALEAAARDPRIVGVVAAAAFADLRTVVAERTPGFFTAAMTVDAIAMAEHDAGFHIDDISPERDADSIHQPVLLLHGRDDNVVSPLNSRRVLSHLTGDRLLVHLEGVGHVDVLLHRAAWAQIEAWLDRHLL